MNIAINIDKNFVSIASVMLFSLCKNNIEESFNVFVFNDDLNKDDIAYIEKELVNYDNVFINDIKVDYDFLKLTDNKFSARWGKQVYYRLMVAELLPDSVDRILYLDSDIIVDGNISDLYYMDMGGNYIAASEDTDILDENDISRIGLKNTSLYLNSGVIVFDLKKIRKDKILTVDTIKATIEKYGKKLIFPDQDIMNIIFEGCIEFVDFRKYNFLCSRGRYTSRQLRFYRRRALIYHYGGGNFHRPWEKNYVGKFGDVFWYYAKCTSMANKYNETFMTNQVFKMCYVIRYELHIFIIRVKGRFYRWIKGNE